MKREAQENADKDRKYKEEIDKLNATDGLIFQTEKQIKESENKLSKDNHKQIEDILQQLKNARASKNLSEIDRTTKILNEIWTSISQELYTAKKNSGKNTSAYNTHSQNENVQDVDFEEVK